MKKIFIILLFFINFVCYSQHHIYYVAPTGGSDSNAGTNINAPWATWQHAFDVADAGDTVFFRGGIWNHTNTVTLDPTLSHGHIGTHDHPIHFFNYPGEFPIIDGTGFTSATLGILIDHTSYIKFKGITVRNIPQNSAGQTIVGWYPANGGNYYFENCTSHNNGGHGWQAMNYDTLIYINCDSYNNYDPLTDGNTSDGFAGGSGGTTADTLKYTYWYGCRAWYNSDDGFDMGTTKQTYTINCWAFLNGYPLNSPTAEGDGIKCGPSHTRMPSKRLVQNCISAFNKGAAFSHNNMREEFNGPVMKWDNNFAYKCSTGWFFPYSDVEPPFDPSLGGGNVIMTNNIVYDMNDYWAIPFLWGSNLNYVHQTTNNSNMTINWPYESVNITTTDADFVTLDQATAVAQMSAARKSDGSLPDITFGKLVASSDLIDRGTNIGLPYNGAAPDIGYSEYRLLDVSNNYYDYVSIGSQMWITTNLKTIKLNNNSPISNVTDNTSWAGLSSSAYSWYNNDSVTYKDTYGALYNWYAINSGLLCPTGWHIPTDNEFKTMELSLGMGSSQSNATGWRGTTEGTGLKSTSHWLYSGNGSNTNGFNGQPSGFRYSQDGKFYNLGLITYWWTSTEYNSTGAYCRRLDYNKAKVYRDSNLKQGGKPVRCVKD